ncbi:hypothetical protein Tco_1185088 [Tanacetum coccineum]
MLLTLDLNHPSIVQLSPEFRSGIGCLYHKSLQRSKLIVTTSFGWSGPEVYSGGLLQRLLECKVCGVMGMLLIEMKVVECEMRHGWG